MARKITKLTNPGTDMVSFMVTASNGTKFAVDVIDPHNHKVAEEMLRRHVSNYERDLMKKFVEDVDPLLKAAYKEGHTHPKETK